VNNPRVFTLSALCFFALTTAAYAQSTTETKTKYRFKIESSIRMVVGAQKIKIVADTLLDYLNTRKGQEIGVLFRQLKVVSKVNDQENMNIQMSRSAIVQTQNGSATKTPFAKASPAQQTLMKDSFNKTIAKITVDAEGKESKREIVASSSAKSLVDNGMIDNARIFHPRFAATKTWTSKRKLSMGNGNSVSGDLKYEKQDGKDGAGNIIVKVSGVMIKKSVQQGAIEMKNIKYSFTGQQSYSSTRKLWLSGTLTIKTSFDIATQGGDGKADGSMKLSLIESK
jgi:hypothetical protein